MSKVSDADIAEDVSNVRRIAQELMREGDLTEKEAWPIASEIWKGQILILMTERLPQ